MQKIIKKGEWKHSGNTYLPILLVEQDWENFQGKNHSRFLSSMNQKESVYLLHFGKYFINEHGNIFSDSNSEPFFSIEEAMNYAERNIEILNWIIEDQK